jgi:hypothetical protein
MMVIRGGPYLWRCMDLCCVKFVMRLSLEKKLKHETNEHSRAAWRRRRRVDLNFICELHVFLWENVFLEHDIILAPGRSPDNPTPNPCFAPQGDTGHAACVTRSPPRILPPSLLLPLLQLPKLGWGWWASGTTALPARRHWPVCPCMVTRVASLHWGNGGGHLCWHRGAAAEARGT